MEAVEIIEETICEKAIGLRSTMPEHTEQTFKMFAGPVEDIVLQFPPKLIGPVYDKFGEDTQMMRAGDNVIASVKVQVSPTLLGWLLQFGEQMKIISPEEVISEHRRELRILTNIMRNNAKAIKQNEGELN